VDLLPGGGCPPYAAFYDYPTPYGCRAADPHANSKAPLLNTNLTPEPYAGLSIGEMSALVTVEVSWLSKSG
jgi:hypothetical protein